MAGNEGEIDPGAIWIPGLNADELEATASDLVGDGETMAESGNDIKSAWQGLQEVYAAPESETLFTAVDPVAADGDDIQDALATVGDALTTFAQEAKQIKQNLVALKGDAKTFLESIDGDDDWREDEEKVEEHEALRIDINHQIRNYQEAERNCANKITGIFGGTTFIGADPGKPTVCKPNERVYGVNYIPEEAATPWGAPQEVDEPFWMEALQGLGNIAAGVAEGVGVYGPNVVGDMGLVYPLSPQWFSNMGDQLKDSAAFAGSLTGFYDYKTGELGVGSPYEWAENFYPAWIEVGHAFVPWRESDRPGYVFSQAVFNFGTLGVGAALKFGKLGRLGAEAPPPEAPAVDPMKHVPNPNAPAHAGNPDNPVESPSVQQLHEQLDEMASLTEKGYSPTDAMEIVAGIPMREHAMAGGPDIQANADGPNGPDGPNNDPPPAGPSPTPSGTDNPTSGAPGTGPAEGPGPGGGPGDPPSGGQWSPPIGSQDGPDADPPAGKPPGETTPALDSPAISSEGVATKRAEADGPFDPADLGELAEQGDGTPEAVNRTIEQLRRPGALGDEYKRDVVDPDRQFDVQHERPIADLRDSKGYHVTSYNEDSSQKSIPQFDAWERSGPDDPGKPVEYKNPSSIGSMDKRLRNALSKLSPNKYPLDIPANFVIDTRDSLGTSDVISVLENRIRQNLNPYSHKLDNLDKIDVYTSDNNRVTYTDQKIYINGNPIREWKDSWQNTPTSS
ncbi:hypothetical protein GCM10027570_32100 [Streptomonospora sediminis]